MENNSVMYLVTAILGFFPGTYIMQYVKEKFGWEDKKAFALIAVLSLVIGLLSTYVSGAMGVTGEITVESVIQIATVWFSASQIYYKMILESK